MLENVHFVELSDQCVAECVDVGATIFDQDLISALEIGLSSID